MPLVVGTLTDIAAVHGVGDQVNGVVVGEGNVGQTADESRSVLVQCAEHYAVHAACSTNDTYTASVLLGRRKAGLG